MTTSDVPAGLGITVHLPFDQDAARAARELVEQLLEEQTAEREQREDAALVVHELVINAVRHGRPDPAGNLEFSGHVVGRQLVVSVVDRGTLGQVEVRPPDENSSSGRGLAIVSALSDSWWVDRQDGTRVSATLAL